MCLIGWRLSSGELLEEDETKVNDRQLKIKQLFKEKMGLLVDILKAGGTGSSNDGNTDRCFFNDPGASNLITGIYIQIITRFGVILRTLWSDYDINEDVYEEFALRTAEMFVERYSWYYMPPTFHKILIHGRQVISSTLIPIGQLSEAQESRNKYIRRYREHFSRKISRRKTNLDVMHRLLMSSDPLISSMRQLPKKLL